MKASEALRRARKKIETMERKHTCSALEDVLGGNYDGGVQRASDRIHQLLSPYSTLEGWLYANVKTFRYSNMDPYKVWRTRLAWIDDMIKWHEARGD